MEHSIVYPIIFLSVFVLAVVLAVAFKLTGAKHALNK